MKPLVRLEATYVVLANEDVDTDQIIPARFLTAISRDGLGEGLFADWRYDAAGAPRPDFVLNRPEAAGAEVLVAGRNFGCGSSREHAAWALQQNGFRAVVSTEIADIFASNALKNGLLPVVVPQAVYERLVAAGTGTLQLDVERQTITAKDGSEIGFELDPFARHCLLEGVDPLGFLLQQEAAVAAFERRRDAGNAEELP